MGQNLSGLHSWVLASHLHNPESEDLLQLRALPPPLPHPSLSFGIYRVPWCQSERSAWSWREILGAVSPEQDQKRTRNKTQLNPNCLSQTGPAMSFVGLGAKWKRVPCFQKRLSVSRRWQQTPKPTDSLLSTGPCEAAKASRPWSQPCVPMSLLPSCPPQEVRPSFSFSQIQLWAHTPLPRRWPSRNLWWCQWLLKLFPGWDTSPGVVLSQTLTRS